jgi:regulator of nucleoside diphosphate kinase
MVGAHTADAADDLNYELDRATLVRDDALPADIVRMGSTVTFRLDGGEHSSARLVYPEQADADAGRVSILTPLGTALLGLRTGQSLRWRFRGGATQLVEVVAVSTL